MDNNKKCIHCMNLKTKIIKDRDPTLNIDILSIPILKNLNQFGELRVYYCTYGKINKVYMNERRIDKITKINCELYNKKDRKAHHISLHK